MRTFFLVSFLVDDRDVLDVLAGLILVAPTPYHMATVSGPFHPFADHVLGYGFEVVGPADFGEEVDEGGGGVGRIVAQLGRLVVPREDVVVVVPSFAQRQQRDALVLRRMDIPDGK